MQANIERAKLPETTAALFVIIWTRGEVGEVIGPPISKLYCMAKVMQMREVVTG